MVYTGVLITSVLRLKMNVNNLNDDVTNRIINYLHGDVQQIYEHIDANFSPRKISELLKMFDSKLSSLECITVARTTYEGRIPESPIYLEYIKSGCRLMCISLPFFLISYTSDKKRAYKFHQRVEHDDTIKLDLEEIDVTDSNTDEYLRELYNSYEHTDGLFFKEDLSQSRTFNIIDLCDYCISYDVVDTDTYYTTRHKVIVYKIDADSV